MKKIMINSKIINIYYEEEINKDIPLIINNSYNDDGENLYQECLKLNIKKFILVNISNINWEKEMTPWKIEPIFKNDNYKGEADKYLLELTNIIIPKIIKEFNIKPSYYILSGYSLGALFAIYALYKTNKFTKIVAASPSLWYPNFTKYMKENNFYIPSKIYLSLGDKEKNSKNKILKTIYDKMLETYDYLKNKNIDVTFTLNNGGHFKDVDKRVAKGIKNILEKE